MATEEMLSGPEEGRVLASAQITEQDITLALTELDYSQGADARRIRAACELAAAVTATIRT